MIKTWQERCAEHPDHEGIVSTQMIMDRMQEEIDELRQALVHDALDRMVAENQRLGLYDDAMDKQEAVDWEAVAADQADDNCNDADRKQKEWVGLTEEDIDSYALDIGVTASKAPQWLVEYARDIERLSREKNS